jgi:tRNA A58 N-methylase Trm61
VTRPLRAGEKVLLLDSKRRRYLVQLVEGGEFHSHAGFVPHEQLIGQPEGTTVRSTHGARYTAVRPTLADYVLKMPRGAQVIYPKDIGPILLLADVFPGARVLESGVGSGAMSAALLRAGADVVGYEVREEFADRARVNVEGFLGAEEREGERAGAGARFEHAGAGEDVGLDEDRPDVLRIDDLRTPRHLEDEVGERRTEHLQLPSHRRFHVASFLDADDRVVGHGTVVRVERATRFNGHEVPASAPVDEQDEVAGLDLHFLVLDSWISTIRQKAQTSATVGIPQDVHDVRTTSSLPSNRSFARSRKP